MAKILRFIQIDREILQRTDVTAPAKIVHSYLVWRANEDGVCWPGIRTIATECGLTHGVVERALSLLASLGIWDRTAPASLKRGASVHYKLRPQNRDVSQRPQNRDVPKMGTLKSQNGDVSVPKMGTEREQGELVRTISSPEQKRIRSSRLPFTVEPKQEPTPVGPTRPAWPIKPDGLPDSLWDAYLHWQGWRRPSPEFPEGRTGRVSSAIESDLEYFHGLGAADALAGMFRDPSQAKVDWLSMRARFKTARAHVGHKKQLAASQPSVHLDDPRRYYKQEAEG